VVVGVDDKAHGLVCDFQFLQGGLNFLRQRRKLVVYDNNAVFSDGSRDVSALTLQHVNAAGDAGGLDLNLGPVGRPLRPRDPAASERRDCQPHDRPEPRQLIHRSS
jgi:hypothetical protein